MAEPVAGHEARRTALAEHARLSGELSVLRATAAKARQLNRRVELNLAIRDLETRQRNLADNL